MTDADKKILVEIVKQTIFEIFDEETIAQIDLCLRRIIADELDKRRENKWFVKKNTAKKQYFFCAIKKFFIFFLLEK